MKNCDDDPPKKFEIYMGRSIAELDKRSEHFPSDAIKRLPVLKLCKCCRKLMNEAEFSYGVGDQEMAYVKYNRYFTIIHIIRASPDYERNKSEIHSLLGPNREQMESVTKLEKLVGALKPRYQKLMNDEKQLKKHIELQNPYKPKPPTPPRKHKESAYFPTNPAYPVDSLPELDCRQYMTCHELSEILCSMLKGKSNQILLDCRPYTDFFESSIIHPNYINIDEETIQLGMTAAQIASKFVPREKELWKTRDCMDHIIIYDWSTNEDEPIVNSPLHTLLGILTLWDPDVNYKSLKFLKGGFEEFLNLYPPYTTNPKVKPRAKICPVQTIVADIEYPSISDITMKEETFNVEVKTIPVINRDTKPDSLKKYNEKNLKEMVERREQLADKSVLIEKERLLLEEAIKIALIASECADDEHTKEEEYEKVIQLEYDVMQLENSKQDVAEESNIVSDKITEEQAFIPDAIPLDKMKQIEAKECEAQKLNEMNKKLAHEKRLSDTREVTPIKRPIIDRSVKPRMPTSGIQREFEPVMASPTDIVVRGLTGLKNLGNTCYMNCILQCISNTNSLTYCFIQQTYKKYLRSQGPTKGVVAENIANLVRLLWCGDYKNISPKLTFQTMGSLHPTFASGQQDAHEFLVILIESLHTDLKGMPEQTMSPKISSAEKAWMSFKANNESIIMDLFYGQIKSTLKCKTCSYESSTFDPFSDLSLEIPKTDRRFKLTDCLNLYFNGELVEGWKCPICATCRDAIKKLDIIRLPTVLVIHLKRFAFDSCGGQKITNYIDFPIEHLQMNRYIAPSELRNIQNNHSLNADYKLYGIVNHYGELAKGHYTSFCRNSTTARWYHFNDDKITALEDEQLTSSAAYILFYSKLSGSEPPNF